MRGKRKTVRVYMTGSAIYHTAAGVGAWLTRVDALVFGGAFAVHRVVWQARPGGLRYRLNGWRVTHVPSGLSCLTAGVGFKTRFPALVLAERLVNEGWAEKLATLKTKSQAEAVPMDDKIEFRATCRYFERLHGKELRVPARGLKQLRSDTVALP